MRTPQEIASETINYIINELNQEETTSSLSNERIDSIIKKYITAAYEEGGETRKKEIYKVLSLHLHPDKLNKQYPQLFTYLQEKELVDVPFKLVVELNTGNLLYKIAADPMNGLGTSYAYLINKLTPLFSVYERYWQPFKFIAEVLSWLILIPVLFGIGIGTLIFFIVQFIVDFLDKMDLKMLNVITENQYSMELKECLTPQFEELKQEHLDLIRKEGREHLVKNNEETREWDERNDDDLYELLVTNECIKEIWRLGRQGASIVDQDAIRVVIKEQYKQKLLSEGRIIGFAKVKIVFNAFYANVTKPLSEQGIFSKLAQLLLAPLSIISSSVIELARFANTAVLLVITGISLLGLVIPMFLLNTPLYIIDLSTYLIHQIGQYIHSPANQEMTDSSYDVDDHNSGPKAMRLLALEDVHKEDGSQYDPLNVNSSEPSLRRRVEVSSKDSAILVEEGGSINSLTL